MEDFKIKPIHIGMLALLAGGVYLFLKNKKEQQPLAEEQPEEEKGGGGSGGGGGSFPVSATQPIDGEIKSAKVQKDKYLRKNIAKIGMQNLMKKQTGNIVATNPNASSMVTSPSSGAAATRPQANNQAVSQVRAVSSITIKPNLFAVKTPQAGKTA
jgi:hypothetical protein